MRIALAVLLAAVLLPACSFANLTPQARFSEASYSLNDAAKWGRADLAVSQVAPAYRERFIVRHGDWGGPIAIADTEVVLMRIGEDRKSALSEVHVSWYRSDGVSLRQSFISQKWEVDHGKFLLVDEQVRAGDPEVFSEPPEAASGGGSQG